MNNQDINYYKKWLFDNFFAYRQYKVIAEKLDKGEYNPVLLSMPVTYVEKLQKLVTLYEEMQMHIELVDALSDAVREVHEKRS